MNVVHRFAVASKEGLAISEHFGHARQFYVYAVGQETCQLLEKREVSHYCLGGHSDKNALSGILETIKDCSAVFVAKIGDGPIDKLAAHGITAVPEYAWEAIEPSLLDYVSQRRS